MNNKTLRVGVLLLLTLFLNAHGEPNSAPKLRTIKVVVQAPKTLKKRVEILLKKYPKIDDKYRILVVKPDPNIDYKIIQIKPDPKVDYKIHILDPETKKIIPELYAESKVLPI